MVILNTAEEGDDKEEKSEIKQGDEDKLEKQGSDDAGEEFSRPIEIAVNYESNEPVNENIDGGTNEELNYENAEKDIGLATASSSALDIGELQTEERVEEDESPISRIHSEILELTRKISLPEAGLLNLIRATEEAENEAKRQQESRTASSPSKESLLLRALAEHGNTDFSVYGAVRGVPPQEPKQTSTSPPRVSKAAATGSKTKLQNDDGGKISATEKESLGTSLGKDRTVTLNSEGVATGDVNAQAQTADELPKTADKGTETGRSEVTTDRDMLGVLHDLYMFIYFFSCATCVCVVYSRFYTIHIG